MLHLSEFRLMRPAFRMVWVSLALLVCLYTAGCQSIPPALGSAKIVLAAPDQPAAIRAEGRLVPRSYVTLSAADGVRPDKVMVQEDQQVAAGDVLILFEGYESKVAETAAAELELLLADQELEKLFKHAGLESARVELALAEAIREQALAEDHLASLVQPIPQWQIDQAYANLQLADNQLANARQDLEKSQKKYANKKSILWRFINQRQFRLQITMLEAEVAQRERRSQDAQEKYQDLLDWPDAIDLALAESGLEHANANLQHLQSERTALLKGPHEDDLQLAQSRQEAAQSRLAAAEAALAGTVLRAPMDGIVVELNARPGEWLAAGRPAVVLAGLDQWVVETEDLDEASAARVQPAQAVRLTVNAIPELALEGEVEQIDLLFTEDDDEVFYTVRIITHENDPRLRWGMKVKVEIYPPESSG